MEEKCALRMSLMLSSGVPPEQTLAVARFAEQSGYSKLWITEDYFRKGAFSTTGAVLAATERLEVGLGVASAYVRSPAVLAMEVATLEAMFPHRFHAGIGMGLRTPIQALERVPEKVIRSLKDRARVLRSLLAGERVTWRDEFDVLTGVGLEYPVATPPPLWLAAESPQMLRLAAAEFDGLILSALSSPGYVRWVQHEIEPVLIERGRPLSMVAFVYVSLHQDEATAYVNARDFLARRLAAGRKAPTLVHNDHWAEIEPLLGLPADDIRGRLRPEVVASFVAYGPAESCHQRLTSFGATGIGELALSPIPAGGRLDLAEVMPLLALLAAA